LPHSVFTSFVWLSEQAAIIYLYHNQLTAFYNPEGVCLTRVTKLISEYN